MITALVVEDELSAARRFAALLAAEPDVTLVGVAGSVADAARLLADRVPDVVFLDIGLPGGDGFDLVRRVPAATRIVFVTARTERALDAFDVGAVDYLTKPVDRHRLAVTIDRLRGRPDASRPSGPWAESGPAAAAGPGGPADVVPLPLAGSRQVDIVPISAIAWVAACRNMTRVQVAGRRPLLVRRSITAWDSLLPPEHFGRIDRSLLIRFAAIRSTQWRSRCETVVFFRGCDGPLSLGRAATTRLKAILPR